MTKITISSVAYTNSGLGWERAERHMISPIVETFASRTDCDAWAARTAVDDRTAFEAHDEFGTLL